MIVVGIAVRLVLAPFFAHPYDVYAFYINGQNFLSGRWSPWEFMVPYSYAYFLFAFPATWVFNALSALVGPTIIPMSSLNPALNPGPQWGITVVPGLLYDFLVKLPLIASDTIIAFLVYRLVSLYTHEEKLALSATMLWFLNPLAIWISSGWGMMDTLPTLFTVLALYFVLEGRFAYSGISVAVGVAMKYYPLFLVFPLLLMAWRRGGRKGFLETFAGVSLAGLALFLPSLSLVTQSFVYTATVPLAAGVRYSGLTFWTALTLFSPSFSPGILSEALTGVLMLAAYIWMWRRRAVDDIQTAAMFFALPVLILLLTYGFVGENFFVWLLPFGAMLAVKGPTVKRLYWFITLVALLSSVTESLLPYYMLPMAPWIGNYLGSALGAAAPYRVAPAGEVVQGLTLGKLFLSSLGVVSALAIVLSFLGWVRGGALGLFKSIRLGRAH